jgi:quercetin dioxygenase-like cupin family protein
MGKLKRQGGNTMRSKVMWLIAAGLLCLLVVAAAAQKSNDGSAAKRGTVKVMRLYTGPDGQTHAEEVEAKFTPGKGNDVYKLMGTTGSAELHRAPVGTVIDWHTAPRRQYVITLSGHGELEVAGGKKISVGPGQIDLVEDTTGKGHITKVVGTEDRVTLQLPLADQSGK